MQNKKASKKINERTKLIILVAIIILIAIIVTLVIRNIIISNNARENEYLAAGNENSSLIANNIKKGITIGGITGTLESLDTSDANATPEDIEWGKTGYVNGVKIVGTMLTSNKVSYLKDKNVFFDENKEVKDDLDNIVTVPKGFKVSSESAVLVEDGIVIEDKKGNQFVWIPAGINGVNINTTNGTKTIKYARTDFGIQFGSGITDDPNDYSGYYESMPADERASIEKYSGYYIGRFDAGDSVATAAKRMRQEEDSASNTVTIKKGDAPYNYVTKSGAIALAEGMAQKESYDAKTKMTSAFAWDTAINFIKIKNSDYDLNSEQGNYIDTSFQYTDITTENLVTKAENDEVLVPNGQTTAVSNIFDMGGNTFKYTSESYLIDGSVYDLVYRGGTVEASKESRPSAYRGYTNVNFGGNNEIYGFRITLYIN